MKHKYFILVNKAGRRYGGFNDKEDAQKTKSKLEKKLHEKLRIVSK